MDIAAGWYPDPAASGMLRYWTGTSWSVQTTPQTSYQQVATYGSAVAVAPAPPGPWSNHYGRPPGASRSGKRTALTAALAVLLGLVALVVVGVAAQTFIDDGTKSPASAAPSRAPVIRLPERVAGLKVFVVVTPLSGLRAPGLTSAQALRAMERGFESSLLTRGENHGQAPRWASVSTGQAGVIMSCTNITLAGVAVRNCAFIDGGVIGNIGVYLPGPGATTLVNTVRAAVVHQ